MSAQEIAQERAYRITERLGILCGKNEPTPEQRAIAKAEADAWEAKATEPEQKNLI